LEASGKLGRRNKKLKKGFSNVKEDRHEDDSSDYSSSDDGTDPDVLIMNPQQVKKRNQRIEKLKMKRKAKGKME